MKRLSIALATIGLSANIFASLPAGTDPNAVTVPSLPGGIVIGLSGYYLQPTDSNGDLDYAAVFTPTGFSKASVQNVNPGYNFGWGANIGYIFPQTGNDINLSYFNLDTSDTATTAVTFPVAIPGLTDVFFGRFGIPATNAAVSAKAEYDINQVDLALGQFIDVGCRLSLHPNAGVRWADLQRKLTINEAARGSFSATGVTFDSFGNVAANNTTAVNAAETINASGTSDFQGIGPLVGLDASYYIGMGVGAVAHVDTALLVGTIDNTFNTFTSSGGSNTQIIIAPVNGSAVTVINAAGTPISTSTTTKTDSVNRVVPVMDAKLGVNYTYLFNNAANSDLALEVGWQVSDYIDAVDSLAAGTRSTSDLGLNGPYASVVLHV